jgi:hypothetical protein
VPTALNTQRASEFSAAVEAFPVALDGNARMWPGDLLDADSVVDGEPIAGDRRWVHRRDGLGYVHASLLIPAR